MRAYINKDTPFELSWSVEDQVTPELVDQIKKAGNEIGINWLESPLVEILDILQTKYNSAQILEMLYDEDEIILDLLELEVTNQLNGWITTNIQNNNDDVKIFSHLYLPILIIILETKSGRS